MFVSRFPTVTMVDRFIFARKMRSIVMFWRSSIMKDEDLHKTDNLQISTDKDYVIFIVTLF